MYDLTNNMTSNFVGSFSSLDSLLNKIIMVGYKNFSYTICSPDFDLIIIRDVSYCDDNDDDFYYLLCGDKSLVTNDVCSDTIWSFINDEYASAPRFVLSYIQDETKIKHEFSSHFLSDVANNMNKVIANEEVMRRIWQQVDDANNPSEIDLEFRIQDLEKYTELVIKPSTEQFTPNSFCWVFVKKIRSVGENTDVVLEYTIKDLVSFTEEILISELL